MPIEDVQHLLDNSVGETVQVFVDSAMRRREFHPRPSEYTLTFREPITNVYGVEVLDASVPATSYNVDTHSNELLTYVFDEPPPDWRGAGHPLDDVRMLSELGSMPRTKEWLWYVVPSTVLVVDEDDFRHATDSADPPFSTSGLAERSSSYALRADRAFVLRGKPRRVKLYEEVAHYRGMDGFVLVGDDDGYAVAESETEVIAMFRSGAGLSVTRVDDDAGLWDVRTLRVLEEEAGAARDKIAEYVDARHPYQKEMRCKMRRLTAGDFDMETLRQELNDVLEPERISVAGVDRVRLDVTRRLEFFSVQRSFCFAMNRSSLRRSLGFDELADPYEKSAYRPVDFGGERSMFVSRYDETRMAWVLKAPGVVSLIGDGYVKLRCPEVESFLSSTGLVSDSGIAVFKLLGGNQQSNLRLDFNNVQRKPIHPIGRLGRITFRFERPDGQLYNFRGVNHTMLLGIQRWSPTQKMKYHGSLLNPAYKPDLLEYKLTEYDDLDDLKKKSSFSSGAESAAGRSGERGGSGGSGSSSSSSSSPSSSAVDEEAYDYSTDGSYTSDEP